MTKTVSLRSKLRVVATSDTHLYQPELPDGDLLIHAGDLCRSRGTPWEFIEGVDWLGKQPHKNKIYCPGNHDRFAFDQRAAASQICAERGVAMLAGSGVTVEGFSIQCHPWTRTFGRTMAYMAEDMFLESYWKSLKYSDILVTHGPPIRMFDQAHFATLGDEFLWKAVQRAQPAVHIFGHIHEGHGGRKLIEWPKSGRQTLFANVAALGPRLPGEGPGYVPNDDQIFAFDIDRDDTGVKITVDVPDYMR